MSKLTTLQQLQAQGQKVKGYIGSVVTTITEAIVEVEEAKADKAVTHTAALTAAGWTGAGPYTQAVAAPGVTEDANQTVYVGLASGATAEQREAERAAMLSPTGQGEGTITVTADGEKPAIDLPIAVTILGG